jgi:hypothetical protein
VIGITASSVVLIFISLPTIATIIIPLYNCVDLLDEGILHLAMNLDTVCWEGEHEYYMYRVGLISIIIWLFGAPLIALIVMK